MAHITINPSQTSAPSARVSGVVADLKARFTRYRVYRNTLNELSDLSQRELDDLGLSRAMLRRVAYEAAYG